MTQFQRIIDTIGPMVTMVNWIIVADLTDNQIRSIETVIRGVKGSDLGNSTVGSGGDGGPTGGMSSGQDGGSGDGSGVGQSGGVGSNDNNQGNNNPNNPSSLSSQPITNTNINNPTGGNSSNNDDNTANSTLNTLKSILDLEMKYYKNSNKPRNSVQELMIQTITTYHDCSRRAVGAVGSGNAGGMGYIVLYSLQDGYWVVIKN